LQLGKTDIDAIEVIEEITNENEGNEVQRYLAIYRSQCRVFGFLSNGMGSLL
jgi:hypothetical protein